VALEYCRDVSCVLSELATSENSSFVGFGQVYSLRVEARSDLSKYLISIC